MPPVPSDADPAPIRSSRPDSTVIYLERCARVTGCAISTGVPRRDRRSRRVDRRSRLRREFHHPLDRRTRRREEAKITLVAPTGRTAKRLAELTGQSLRHGASAAASATGGDALNNDSAAEFGSGGEGVVEALEVVGSGGGVEGSVHQACGRTRLRAIAENWCWRRVSEGRGSGRGGCR